MDLKEIKESDHSWWLRYLEDNTHFDYKRIKEQIDWLIEQAELAEKYKSSLEEGRIITEEHPSLIIKQEIFDEFINSAVVLFRKIEAKQEDKTATITQEEADFANAFVVYAREITDVIEKQI